MEPPQSRSRHFDLFFLFYPYKFIIFDYHFYINRVGNHSTSDDSILYRTKEEILPWQSEENPSNRLRAHMILKGWWTEALDEEWKKEARKLVCIYFR